MLCLDSDFMIALLRGDKEAITKAEQLEEEPREIVSTAVNALELFVGIVAIDGISGTRVKKTRDFLENLTILNLDLSSAERSAYILNSLEKLGLSIGLKDSLIAGIALEHKADILTRNTKHFERVSGLKVETW
ncbi:MAG: PIN domain-containing protein [Candidatus Heimdallarchaeota archaeon]|nr:MAG: PIN domain-containing protein [Candidatus Heimdallarchaeota archaeon]